MSASVESIDTWYGCTVRDYGARGDGSSDDAEAIQRAIDAGQPLVVIPAGEYKVGKTLRVGSNTHLKAHPAAHLFMADGSGVSQESFLLSNKSPSQGDTAITIEGGFWDGHNHTNPRGGDYAGQYTGVTMDFSNVTGLTLRDLDLIDAESYYIRLGDVRDFLIERIRFQVNHHRPNQDGIHIAGFCENGTVRDICGTGVGATSDDIVALLSDDNLDRAQNLGIKCGPIRNVRISRLRADDCHSFVRLCSARSPIEDIDIYDVKGGCRVCALNLDATRYCMKQAFDPKDPAFQADVGLIRRARISDMTVYRSRAGNPNPLLLLESKLEAFTLSNFHRDRERDADPSIASLRVAHVNQPQLSLEGLCNEQVSGLRAASSNVAGRIRPQAGVGGKERFHASFDVTSTSKLLLPMGGFDQLSA